MRSRALAGLLTSALLAYGSAARADDPPPPAPPASLPTKQLEAPAPSGPIMSLDEAIRLFDKQGFDVLLADAQVKGAQANETAAGRVNNPSLALSAGRAFGYDASQCSGCSAYMLGAMLSDEALFSDMLFGKRGLRVKSARAAVGSAQAARDETRRTTVTQVKLAYIDVAAAAAKVDFAREAQASMEKTLAVNTLRYPKVIDEGQLARVETQKLAADQAVDRALMAAREARVQLAFLLGQRTGKLGVEIDRSALKFALSPKLAASTADELKRSAHERRPDLRGARLEKDRADADVEAARRDRVPDIALNVFYQSQGFGQNAAQPPTVGLGVTAPLPFLYQKQGEIGRAEADKRSHEVSELRALARIDADVEGAFAQVGGARGIVERYERGGILERARRARDISELQYNAGSAPLIEFLDAQRTLIALNQDYVDALAAYWAAVFRLEEATALDLRR